MVIAQRDGETSFCSADGQLSVSRKVVKRLVHRVVSEVPGVLQLGGDSLIKKLLRRLGIPQGPRGIELELGEGEAAMTLTLVVRLGTRLPALAAEVRRRVKQALREQLGLRVRTVNVHVRSLKGPCAPQAAAGPAAAPYQDFDREALRDLQRRPRLEFDEELGL